MKFVQKLTIESNKHESLTKMMYLMQMQIVYCYVKYVFLIMFPLHSDWFPPSPPPFPVMNTCCWKKSRMVLNFVVCYFL